ncbi:unnamed protein product [Tilletia controversa]|uniref:RlpA-like protein double-psi beta-barrel domain-containing protein n=3 Tax=Tilletia TaxID=13289 RepID=A0A8X7MW11_9BASI|nr:hypothetical protein CF336_g2270 [Tilletia laevis]KAE8202461.1 hypothetical protein CF328_g2210 [Tilletia controversa]KAE8263211.1 hypothetical protein A4X03_0g1845 [Tilletia caries]KAE8208386.1 hypothetical protein CF335_g459 [Tilletia laevis]KAE8251317.1 hypothetical protein A4X06_0g2728 [Tilletia controversa]
MARINFVALAAAMVLAMVALPSTVSANEVAVGEDAVLARSAAFDPLNDPDIEILQDVEDTDFDDILDLDHDEDAVGELASNTTAVRRTRTHKHKSDKHRKHSHRHSRNKIHVSSGPSAGAKLISKNQFVTWYSAHDLLNPACGAGKWQPSPRSHVAAIGGSSNLKCGDFVQLCVTNKKKCVTVRIVDACAGCNTPQHIDLSKSAFMQLATGGLDQGEVHGVHSYKLGEKITPWALNLFGGKLERQGNKPY